MEQSDNRIIVRLSNNIFLLKTSSLSEDFAAAD